MYTWCQTKYITIFWNLFDITKVNFTYQASGQKYIAKYSHRPIREVSYIWILGWFTFNCLSKKLYSSHESIMYDCSWKAKDYEYRLPSRLGLWNTPTAPLNTNEYLNMILNNLMGKFQWCWSFGECGALLLWHLTKDHSGPDWEHLTGPYLWV